ncbi:hypothetical protein [Ramlibacter sp. AN1133]|uniref:hypothetical protein n=1 Tax=Ramlibacter sp. AN1133 TaxID=3133429 RepID=UPI0030C09338
MKNLVLTAAAIATALILSACGGGGGGGDGSATSGTTVGAGTTGSTTGTAGTTGGTTGGTTTPAATDPGIAVVALAAPNYTVADCARFTNDAAAVAALDLSNTTIKQINDYLQAVDADHAYKVFIRRPYDFANWIASLGGSVNFLSLGIATHETLHMTDSVLRLCAPAGYKTLFLGNIVDTGLQGGDTASTRIVDTMIDTALKPEPRFATYITGAAAGNDFTVLLDEFAAYAGAARTTTQAHALGKLALPSGSLDSDLGGTVNFMVFLETYLKAARLNNAATYDTIRTSAATKAAIQTIWTAAEKALVDSYPLVKAGSLTVNTAYFSAAYSGALLSELDAIGISHATTASWSGTYLP